MGIDKLFAKDINISVLVEEMLVLRFPTDERDSRRERIIKLLEDWEGREADVLGVLHHAIERERFDEYVDKLQTVYEEDLVYIPKDTNARRSDLPGAIRTEEAVKSFYEEMEVKPNKR